MQTDRVTLAFASLILFIVIANIIWAGPMRGSPQHWDSAIHLSESLGADRLTEEPEGVTLKSLLNVSWFYPPLVSYVAVPFYGVLGESPFAAFQVMSFFLVVLILSVYLIGRRMFDRSTAILAALIVCASPIVVEYSRMFMLDLPLASMVALSVWCLLRTDDFERPFASLIAGASLGLGMLTKWTFAFYLAAPFLYMAMRSMRVIHYRGRRVLVILASLAAAMLVALPWYAIHIVQILASRGGNFQGSEYTFVQSAFLYLLEIPGEMSWPVTILLGAGVFAFFIGTHGRRLFLAVWFVTSYLLISLAAVKAPRYAIPLILPLALGGAAGIIRVLRRLMEGHAERSWTVSAVFAGILLQLLLVMFIPVESLPARILGTPIFGGPFMAVHGMSSETWDIPSLLAPISSDMRASGRARAIVRVIPDHPYVNNSTIEFYARLERLPLVVSGTSGFPLFTDYILLKYPALGLDSPDGHRARMTDEIRAQAALPSPPYTVIATRPLPDGSTAILLRVTPQQAKGASAAAVREEVRRLSVQFLERYFVAQGSAEVTVDEIDSTHTSRGQLRALRVRIARAQFGDFAFNPHGIPVSDVDIEAGGVVFNPTSAVERHALEILSLSSLRVRSFAVSASDLHAYLSRSPAGALAVDALTLEDGVVSVRGTLKNPQLGVELAVALREIGTSNIVFHIERARLGIMPLPLWPLNVLTDAYNPLIHGLSAVSEVQLDGLHIRGGELRIGETHL